VISEIKTVLRHHVPFLRNRELIFHELEHNKNLCWFIVAMEEIRKGLKECEMNKRNVRGTGRI